MRKKTNTEIALHEQTGATMQEHFQKRAQEERKPRRTVRKKNPDASAERVASNRKAAEKLVEQRAKQPAEVPSRPEKGKRVNPSSAGKQAAGRSRSAEAGVETRSGKASASRSAGTSRGAAASRHAVKIIPLGGVDGIGMNITAFEYGEDILIVDCGISFPREDMPGVDVVIPDFTYLQKNAQKIRGLILTHGHEDHIGAVPYLLKKIKCDVYATRLTLGILDGKLTEHNIRTKDLYEVRAGESLSLGIFDVEFIHVNHSIPDAVALCITTPCGRIIHTGDFKIDFTPIGTTPIDLGRFAELGRKGVRLLLCDSTNAERAGYTPSESMLTASFDRIINDSTHRVVIATFSSNVHRVQQILEACDRAGRKVAMTGRSLQNVLRAAQELGYIQFPQDLVMDLAECRHYPPEKIAIITTGSQGEPMSALYRMAFGAHQLVTLGPNDLVVLSSSCIPGNEKLVTKIINELYKRSVTVITDRTDDVHVSGHACREELKTLHSLVHADCFVPVHGEYKHLISHANLAKDLGTPEKNVIIPEAGRVIELDKHSIRTGGTVECGTVLIDGGNGDGVEYGVLNDRMTLSESGVVLITAAIDQNGDIALAPELLSRGFVYVKENEELLRYLTDMAYKFLAKSLERGISDPVALSTRLKDDMGNTIYQKTKRKPVIMTSVSVVER